MNKNFPFYMTKSTIICLGKFDDTILSVENQIINLSKNNSKPPKYKLTYDDDSKPPDVVKYSNEDYKCDVWTILGDVKPTLLLKNLLSEANLIIYIFNLSEPGKLAFLTEGWGPIIQKSIKTNSKNQERILLGIKTKSDNKPQEMTQKIKKSKEILQYTRYYEEELSEKTPKSSQKDNFYNFIKNELSKKKSNPPSIGQSNSDFNEEFDERSNVGLDKISGQSSNNLINYEIDENSHKAKIVNWPNAEGKIVIKKIAKYESENYEITDIYQDAFKSSKVTEIFVKTDLKIGDSCFSDSNELKTAKFECNKLTIGNTCFLNCSSLSNISFSGTTEADFGSQIFNGCSQLKFFEIQCGDHSKICIGDECFVGALSLESIRLSADSIELVNNAFKNCEALQKLEIECKNKLSISKELFEGCGSLENVVFKASTLNLLESCFGNLQNLKTIKFECEKIKFGENCFLNCNNVESIEIGCKDEIKLSKKIFSGFQTFTKQDIKNSKGFLLTKLKSLKLSGKKVTINDVYSDFTSLESLYIESCENDFQNDSSILVYLGRKCFQNLSNLQNLKIIGAYVFIGNNCFNNCSSLSNVTISKLMKLGNGTRPFNNCLNIENVTLEYLPNAKLMMGKNPFNKSKIQYFKITDDESETLVVTLGDKCFKNCISIQKFAILSSKEVSFGTNVFMNSKNLKLIKIKAASEIHFGKNCFSKSKSLEDATFQTEKLIIGDSCFNKCDNLKSIKTSINTVLTSGKGRKFERHDSEDNDQSCVYDLK